MTFEKYQKYSDYKSSKWGSPEDLRQDALISVKRVLPTFDEKWIDSIEDVSVEDKGIKFEVKVGKNTVHMFKTDSWRGQWEFYLNKKKIDSRELKRTLEKDNLSDLEIFLKYVESYDFYSQYIDSGAQWRAAEANNKAIEKRFDELSTSDKKKAKKEIYKRFKKHDLKDTIDRIFKI